MRKNHIKIIGILLLASLASCKKDSHLSEIAAFEFDNVKYETLQHAADAYLASPESDNYIKLNRDARGKGIKVDGDPDLSLKIDFGEFNYILEDGESISTGATRTCLRGNGGSLSSNGTVIVSDGGSLFIGGDLDVKGNIKTSSFTRFGDDWKGDFYGKISLADNELFICSEEGRLLVPTLSVTGDGSYVEVEVENASDEVLRVESLISDEKYPVRAFSGEVVKIQGGGAVHVHEFTVKEIPANCMTPARIEKTCADCGYVRVEIQDEVLGKCQEEALVYVPGLLASDNAGGVVGHWECPLCGRCYSDAEGKHEITGPVTLLAGNYHTDYALLHDLDDILNWQNEFHSPLEMGAGQVGAVIEVVGLVLTIAGLVETLGLSLPSLIADDSDKWNEVNEKLDAIQASLDRIEDKIDQLTAKVDAVAYKNLIIERNQKLNFLSTKSISAFNIISGYLEDETLSDDQKKEKISLVLKDWSSNVFGGTSVSDLTQSLMQQYVNTGLERNVPGMFEAVANCSYLWEHDGYNFRYQALAREVLLSSISYMMACYNISSVKDYYSEDVRRADLQSMKDTYKVFCDTVCAELDRIKDRNDKYRRYNPAGVTFSIFAKYYDFRGWFEKHKDRQFPRENQDGRAVASCEAILNDLGLNKEMALTLDIAKEIYNHYNSNNTNPTSIYRILRDSVGFRQIPDGFDPGILFVKRDDKFSHDNDDVAIPTYKIFHWEIYRSHNNEDYFGIRSSLNDKCNQENHNILYQCDISSYSSGEINSLGSKTRWQWCTLVKAE